MFFKHSRSMIRNRKTIRIIYILSTNVGVPYKTFYKAFAYQGKVHQNVSGSRWSGHHNITWNNYRIICLMYANVTRRVQREDTKLLPHVLACIYNHPVCDEVTLQKPHYANNGIRYNEILYPGYENYKFYFS